jgi:hypothetical protein
MDRKVKRRNLFSFAMTATIDIYGKTCLIASAISIFVKIEPFAA